jgi:hypothetical protein
VTNFAPRLLSIQGHSRRTCEIHATIATSPNWQKSLSSPKGSGRKASNISE